MDISSYIYKGLQWKPSLAVSDNNNSFFHSTFGVRAEESDTYYDKRTNFRRLRWATFLTYFETEPMPHVLENILKRCFSTNEKYKCASIENKSDLKHYVHDIIIAEQGVTVEEIPIIATLENIKIVLFLNRRSTPVITNPDSKFLGDYPDTEKPKGEVVLLLEGTIFSRMNPISESKSLENEDNETYDRKSDDYTMQCSSCSTKCYEKYEKGGNAGSEGVKYQVELSTVFFLKAFLKLKNWKLSTENKKAGKFDDVVLEWSEGTTLLQAKHRQSKAKKITLQDLMSTNKKNNDFSLSKYFLSYEELRKQFQIKEVIICTNARVDDKIMELLIPQKVSSESMLYYEGTFYTFKDDILNHLRENVKRYYQIIENKLIDESIITEGKIKDFLKHLQLFTEYHPANVIEKLLSHIKHSENWHGQISYSDIYDKIYFWFQQKTGIYLNETYAKAIFAEIRREKHFQILEKFNISFQCNSLNLKNSKRLLHVADTENLYLAKELRIFQSLQDNRQETLYANTDNDNVKVLEHTIEAFRMPFYTFLILIWSKICDESIMKKVSNKLREILYECEHKRVILLAPSSNTIPQHVGLSIDNYDVTNLYIRFEDLSKDSQEWLLRKKNISFQGRVISLEELLGKYKRKGYAELLNSELLENIMIGENLTVGVKPLDLDKNTKRFYINRKFIKEINEEEDENRKTVQLNEETIYEVNEKVILIADCAGMGKSTVLTKLTMFIKESKPHLWVIRIDLNDYTYILNKYLDDTSKIISILDLLNSKDSTKLINQLEERIFELNGMVVLMVDGVDEISPDYTELILNLLATCQEKSNFSKIFVTTRPNTARELKEKLQVKPFSMQPFTEQNQIDFLTGYWMHNLKVEEMRKHRCEAYAKALIIKMSSWIRLYHYGENHFAAIPLQVRMLAETFEEKPSWNEATYWEGCKEYLYGNEAEPKLPERMKIKKIYDMFINTKRNLFIHKGNPTKNSTSNNALSEEFEKCLTHHRCLALNVIISSRKRGLFADCRHHHKDVEENTFKIGIVQRLEGTYQFLHRTFAEYFVAQSLLEELNNGHAGFQKFLIDEVLIMPEYNVTRVFFDSFLQETVESLPAITFKNFQSQVYMRDSTPRNSLIHILAKDNCIAILQLILKCTCFKIVRDNEVTVPKVGKNNGDFMNTLNDLQILMKEGGINIKDENGITLLHYAAQENHLEMVKFLVSQGAKVDGMNESGSLALHLAAEEGQLDCVIFFAEIGVDINTPNKDNRTALHLASKWGRLDTVKFLVKRDANVNIRDKDGRTALHFASERGMLDTVKFLVECNKHIINIRDNNGCSALHLATDWCQPETIEFLAGFDNIDVNIIDNTGCTPLHFAVRDNEIEIVEFLVDVGVDVNLRNNDGHTALHLASKKGYSDVVDFLLRFGANMNIMDNAGYTALHLAVAGTSYDIKKSIEQEPVVGDNLLQQIQILDPSNKQELISAKNGSKEDNKYEKRGSAGVGGVQFQVGLLTVFLLNALRKVKNWQISTENATAGKFDDVVFECPEGATLVQAKYRHPRKKITFEQLISINLKYNDFSLPKYFLSYQEIKKTFKVKEIIICTNSSIDVETMKFLKTHRINFESMLNYEDDDCVFHTFNDEILPYLRENIINYNKIHFKNKDVGETTNEDIRDFLDHLQVYSSFPSGDHIGRVVEKLLSQMKRLEILPYKISSKSLENKIIDWYQQQYGVYLTEINATAMFSEIWRDERWMTLEKFNIFILRNELNFQNSKRIIHVIIEDGYLLQEIKIFRAFQRNNINILYANADEGMKIVKQVINSFTIPRYTILVLIWAKTAERSMASVVKEIGSLLREILHFYEYKKVVLVTKRNNKFPEYIGLDNSEYEVVNESVSFEDLSKDSRERLLKKEIITFQGKNISLEKLFGMETTENYTQFLNSEVVEKLIRGENITIGTALLDVDNYTRFYIHRKFKRQIKDNKENRKVIVQDQYLTEENMYDVDEKIIIISDHAGTGKSTVLTKLAAVIKEKNPHLWVFRINLNDYTRILTESLSTDVETINILELINSKYSTKLENELERYVFSIDRKVVILLDGLDEVSPDYTELITRLIQQCLNQFNIAKVIVATRPHLMPLLQRIFQVNPFILEPLTEQNYVDFFTKYWMHKLNLVNKSKDKCEQYAKTLVRKMWLPLYQQKDNFPIVPLQVQIIAELFQENNQWEGTLDWEGCREFLLSDSSEPKLPENLNMINMYQIFLEKKRTVFLDKGNPSGNMAANSVLSDYFEESLQAHRSLALEIILGKDCKLFSFYEQSSVYLGSSYDYLLRMGILQKLDNQFSFIDKSFAEYFVAESLIRELICLNQNVDFQKLLIEEIFVEPQFNIIRAFFNSRLQQVVDDIPSNIFQNYEAVACELDLVNKNNVTLLHQLVEEGHVALLKLLFKCIGFIDITERPINLTDLHMTDFDAKILKKVFGNTLIFLKYLVEEAGVNIKNENGVMPLHIASKKGHLEMVKFLVKYGAIIDSRDNLERTSLRLAVDGGHIEAAKFLVDQNADIKAKYKDISILEEAIQEGQTSIAKYILENILKSNGLERKDFIKYLALQGLDFNKKDNNGKTALHLAISEGLLDTVKLLVQLVGMDFNMRDEKGRTYFHLAALWNQLNIAEFFIEVGVNVNDEDEEGCTALHLVAETDKLDIVNFLVKHNLDVNIRNKNGQTALHLAACYGKLDTVKFLHTECSADLNVKDSNERTALHLAVEKDEQKIIKFLVKQGIHINISDKNGRTALHLAASKGYSHTVKFLLECGGDYDITDNDGCTALNLAVSNGRTDTAKFIEKYMMRAVS